MSRFAPATKKKSRARVALVGPSGSGKTYTSLGFARVLAGADGRIAVIDTERGSASKYAGSVADFDVLDLEKHDPREYVQAIRDAAREGYEVLVIDSLSHAWNGRGGALELVDQAASRSKAGNSYTAWRDVTPMHNALIDAILTYPGHVIATMRAKTEYVLEEGPGGKKVPRKIGLAPVQRDGMEYEFDVVADIDHDHTFVVTKTRCAALDGLVVRHPGPEVAERIRAWLDDGVDAPAATTQTRPAADPGALERSITGQPSPVDDAIELLGFVEDADSFTHWCVQHMAIIGGPEKRKAWAAMVARGKRIQLDERDLVPLIDEAKQRIAQQGAAA